MTMADKELMSKIYKQLIQLNIKKIKQPCQKIGRRPEERFPKEGIQMINKRNSSQNNNKVSPNTGKNSCHQKICK